MCLCRRIVTAAQGNLEVLHNPDCIKEISRVLRTNDRVCKTVGPSFAKQMGRLYLELLNMYKVFSAFISGRCVPFCLAAAAGGAAVVGRCLLTFCGDVQHSSWRRGG
jgi:hypothetical protein